MNQLIEALEDAAESGVDIMATPHVPSKQLTAREVYRLTHKWERNRDEIAHIQDKCNRVVKNIRSARPDMSGLAMEGV